MKKYNAFFCLCIWIGTMACKKENERPLQQLSMEVIGLSANQVVWDTVQIEIKLPEGIASEGLKVMIGENEIAPTEASNLQFQINTYELPEGVNLLSLSHPEIHSGQISQLSFEVLNTLLTVHVDENAILPDADLWLIISDAQSQIINYEKVSVSGEYTFRNEGFKDTHYQFSIVRDYSLFPIGTVLYVEHVQRGKEIMVKYPEPFQESFRNGTILMKNIPEHDAYRVSILAGEYFGTSLPKQLPVFFNYIPSRVLVQWQNNDIWKAAFSSQQLTVAGGNVEVDLTQSLSTSAIQIDLPHQMTTSFTTYAFPKAGVYFEGYMVDQQLIENQKIINSRQITQGFEEMEAQLVFHQDGFFGFYRRRGMNLPSQFEDFTARIEVLNHHHDELEIEFTGQADFYELYWSNDHAPASEQKRWLVKQIGDPSKGLKPMPNYAELMPNSFFSDQDQDLRSGLLIEADVLNSYEESLNDLLGAQQYYVQAKNLKQIEFYFGGLGGRGLPDSRLIKVKRPVQLFERGYGH